MTTSTQVQVIDQVKLSLEALVTAKTLKRVYTEPKAIQQAPEFPFAFFRMAADEDYLFSGHGWLSAALKSRILVTLVIQRDVTYATRELAELIAQVRGRIAGDSQAFCVFGVTLSRIQQIADPLVANFFDDFGSATLAIDYTGIDDFK